MKSTVAPYQTTATCVRIECLNGTVVRLTDYPFDLTMSNATVYKTDYGYAPTAYGASSSMSPPAMDLEGICAVGGVTRDALASGVFDNARVFIFKCNFLAPVEDYEAIGAGFFGKTTLQDDHYRIEGMGLVDVLGQSCGKLFTASCQHTPWDAGCGISAASVTVTGTLTAVTSGYVFRDAARTEAADWFAAGTIQFTSGANAGLAPLEIKAYAANGTITLHESQYYPPQIGDAYSMVKGCRRRRADCKANSNIINFFGFPDMPQSGDYIRVGAA